MPLRANMELNDFLEIFTRKKWLITFTVLLIMFGATIYCVVIPDQYKSSVTLLVIPPRVSEQFVRPSTDSSIEARIVNIQQQVLNRTRMMKVIDEMGLYQEERNSKPPEALVSRLQDRIGIDVIRDKNAFILSFAHEDPKMAMLTANRLASFFIEENLRSRERTAAGTTEFLESQLAETKAKLEEQEEKVKRYKLLHSGELPQQMGANLGMLTRMQEQEKSYTEAIARAEDRKLFLETEISKQLRQSGVGKDPMDTLLESYTEKQKQLQDLSARYTDSYPTITQLRREIQQLESKIIALQESDPSGAEGTPGAGSVRKIPVRRIRGENEEVRRLRDQVSSLNLEIKALRREKMENRRSMDAIEFKIGRLPQREQELVSLTRDYDNLKRTYDDLLNKKLEAGISQNLEERQKGEQFQILNAANLPGAPFKPDRKKVLSFAFLGALAIGFGGVIGLEMLDPTLRGTKEFKYFFDLPILATVPAIRDGEYARRHDVRRKVLLAGIVSLASAVTVFLLVYQERIRAILRISGVSE